MAKIITKLTPLADQPLEDIEKQYVAAHTPAARDNMMHIPHVRTYSTARVKRQYDYGGRWGHRITAWRFVIRRLTDDAVELRTRDEQSEVAPYPPSLAPRFALTQRDRPHLFDRIARFHVNEEVIVNRLSGQTSLAKFLFEYDRDPHESFWDAAEVIRSIVQEMSASADDATGLRLFVVNWVHRAREAVRAGCEYIESEWTDDGEKIAFLEFYFDNVHWGEQFFGGAGVNVTMLGATPRSAGYLMQETTHFDKR